MDEYKYPAEKLAEAKAQLANSLLETDWSSGTQGCCDNQLGSGSVSTGGLFGQAWGGTQEPKHVCPNCGYCPCCGRGGGYVPNYPLPYQPWPGYPQPYVGDWPNWQEWNKVYCRTNGSSQPQGMNLQSYYNQ